MGEIGENRAIFLNEPLAEIANAPPDSAVAAARLAERAAQVRAEVPFGLVGAAALVVAAIFIGRSFAGSVDPLLLRWWLAALAVTPISLVLAYIFTRLRPPDDAEVLRIWLPFGRSVRLFMNLVVIASPWILLPDAEPLLQLIMLMLYIWFMATEVLANADPHGLTWVALFGIPASGGAFLIVHDLPYAAPLAALLVVIGGSLFLLERLLIGMRQDAVERGVLKRLAAAEPRIFPAPAPPVEVMAAPSAMIASETGLTRRQIEVLRLMARGLSNKEIARELDIAPATVKTHVADVIAITGATNRTGATMRGQALGLL
jgi:DNA-binding CsgD family transcriptional regulator